MLKTTKNKPRNYFLLFLSIILGSYLYKIICNNSKANLLIITSDDLRAVDMYPYSAAPLEHLPNLNKLANESTVFIADTVYPICNPSRNSLLTGRDFPQVLTFDQNFFALSMQSFLWLLKNNGYYVGMLGKFMHEYDLLLGNKFEFKDDSNIALRGKSLVPALFNFKSKINQYTFFRQGRCQAINESQINLCVTDDNGPCSRPPIIFMGHGVVFNAKNLECRYVAWWPFHEYKICEKPSWPNKPLSLGGYGRVSSQLDLKRSYTDFSILEQQPELYCHELNAKYGELDHPNSNNLAINPSDTNKIIMTEAKKAIINRYSPKF